MSSPYDPGRDSNVPAGNAFGEESDVGDEHVGSVDMGGRPSPSSRLGEADYRD